MNIENLCQICQENSAPYKCPKCRLRYCSLNCYRDRLHQQCVREFAEKEIFDAMNLNEEQSDSQASAATTKNNFVRERIEEILKRKLDEKELHDEQDNENIDELFEHLLPSNEAESYRPRPTEMDEEEEELDPEDDVEERIVSDDEEPLPDLPDDLDESDEKITQLWSYLTAEEKREFKTMLADGRISHLLNDYKPWKPWWLYQTAAPSLITDAETPTAPPTFPETIPSVTPSIVPLPTLTSILPHVHVRFDVLEILFAYVFISIRYRGDFYSYLTEAGAEFLHIASRHLTPMSNLSSEDEDSISILHARISLLRERVQENDLSIRISEEFFVNLLGDVLKLVHGPYPRGKPSNYFVLAALSDLKRFLTKIQEYQPPVDSSSEATNESPTTKNVFHQDRTTLIKVTGNRSSNSKLCLPKTSTASKPVIKKQKKTTNPFPRKTVQMLARKIDYFLSWTVSHGNRLVMLDHELEHVLDELRRQWAEYQRDKTRIEKNFQHIRLQQSTNTTRRIEEL